MTSATRFLRLYKPAQLRRLPQRYTSLCRPHLGSRTTSSIPRPTQPPFNHTSNNCRRSAIDPFSLLITFAASVAVAYVTFNYTSKDPPPEQTTEESISLAPSAHLLYPLTMAPSMPPGRPGTLTADQEAKLKEMWQQALEIFGVSHDDHANGTSTPSGTDSTPDAKKKKKGRLSMFHRRDKSEDLNSSSGDGDNDKHGPVLDGEMV